MSNSFLESMALLLLFCYLFGWTPNQGFEVKTVRTVGCSHFHEGHLLSTEECFDYAKNHKDERYLVNIREREFHVSFSNHSVTELNSFREARSYSCQVFDSENWVCPIGSHANDFNPDRASNSSRIVMKNGDIEEWLNAAIEPQKDIHLDERTTHFVGNLLEFKILRFCLFFGIECKPSYNIDAEDDYWL